ncbi:alanine racemase [Sphingorhabdus lutea]|uniref:Alanine racemase n=2 Tax=Sphingorhabdus lutea TaxID=1913578 RepID=A0A1L3JED6_9SPHN|nr:alanine racemase [Sphingorhabdus lutea]
MARGAKRSTSKDVAKLAGVSPKTVSRVFNDEPHVTPAVREKVMKAAEELHYHPNIMARGLVRRRSFLIGLIYERPSPSYVVELQRGALRRLKDERYRLIVLSMESMNEQPKDLAILARNTALDGIILAPPACDIPEILDGLTKAKIPFSRIAPVAIPDLGLCTTMDDVAAAYESAQYLTDLGHRDVAIIKGDPLHAASARRTEGYIKCLTEQNISINPNWVEEGNFSFESGYDAAMRILSHDKKPTAILAQNDDMAVGAMSAAQELGLSIPGDISIVGYDDSEIARTVWPRLTTVRQPVEDMAFQAADLLLKQFDDMAYVAPAPLPHEMMIRQSAAPPRND